MRAAEFWKAVTVDGTDLLGDFVRLLDARGIRYCVIGGQAVNAYVEPLVSLDLDVVIAADQVAQLTSIVPASYRQETFAHSLNLSRVGSDLRIQVQTDPQYASFVERATVRNVLGVPLPVAALDDVLQGKIWAASDSTRRGSKRQKDLADISRIIESFPHLRDRIPVEILARLA